jgi:hypothetical protein
MKGIEDGCDVKMLIVAPSAGSSMKKLCITGTLDAREQAKSAIVRLGKCCQEDSFTNIMDAWDDCEHPWSGRDFLHRSTECRFENNLNVKTDHKEFDTGEQRWWIAMLQTPGQNYQHDANLHRVGQLSGRRQKGMVDAWEDDICRYQPHSANTAGKGISFAEEAASGEDMEEQSDVDASAIIRNLSRYSNEGGLSTKLQSYTKGIEGQFHVDHSLGSCQDTEEQNNAEESDVIRNMSQYSSHGSLKFHKKRQSRMSN